MPQIIRQNLIAMNQFPTVGNETLHCHAAFRSRHGQFCRRMGNTQQTGYLRRDLFRPVLSRVGTRVFEQPFFLSQA